MTNDKRPDSTVAVKPQDSPLARWSARKRQVQQANADTLATATPEQASNAAPDQPIAEPLPELTDDDMPPLDSIDEHSDLSGFFSPKVSAELRRQALRKLFQLPAYNIRDGLNDYDDDFTNFTELGDIVTSDMRHAQELKAQQQAQAEQAQQATATEATETETVNAEAGTETAPATEPETSVEQATEAPDASQAESTTETDTARTAGRSHD